MGGFYHEDDHRAYWRYDIVDIPSLVQDPFIQEEGTIYWINISVIVDEDPFAMWGWKSSQDHYEDDAVWALAGPLDWIDMYEPPLFEQSLDLAFCITSGPVEDVPTLNEWGMLILGLLLLTAGTIAVVRRRKTALTRAN